MQQELSFPCPSCGGRTRVDQKKESKEYISRGRACTGCSLAFMTLQRKGAGEILDCYAVAGVNRNSTQYRNMLRTYQVFKDFLEFHGTWRSQACLERARQKAGLSRREIL